MNFYHIFTKYLKMGKFHSTEHMQFVLKGFELTSHETILRDLKNLSASFRAKKTSLLWSRLVYYII